MRVLVLGAGRNGTKGLSVKDRITGTPILGAEWITLDALPTVGADLVCTLGRERIPLDDDSIDYAFALQLLEHIGRQGYTDEWFTGEYAFWPELYRVMAPGARLHFESPRWDSVWAWADPTHTRVISQECFTYLNQDGYRQGGAIPDFRPRCDFVLRSYGVQDAWCGGELEARKPFRPYWHD
jgi:hypothetical protein